MADTIHSYLYHIIRELVLLAKAEASKLQIRFIADLLVGEHLTDTTRTANLAAEELTDLSEAVVAALNLTGEEQAREIGALQARAQRLLNQDNPRPEPRRPFHWPLEFPEVMQAGGFQAIVGNPPFVGGKKITGAMGTTYRNFLVDSVAGGQKGCSDICAYFFLRVGSLLSKAGQFGLIATNTTAQGDTREVGLDQLVKFGSVYRAVPSQPWPGVAAIEVACCWYRRGAWDGAFNLDHQVVSGISAYLTVPSSTLGNPHRLVANSGKSFIGSYVLGMGFVLEPEAAAVLIAKNPKNKEVLFPYLNGQDLNTNPDQSPSRWVINFFDWPLDADYDDPQNPQGPPYAADYPDCLDIVIQKVKPERDKNKRKERREKWWHYAKNVPHFTRPSNPSIEF